MKLENTVATLIRSEQPKRRQRKLSNPGGMSRRLEGGPEGQSESLGFRVCEKRRSR